MTNIRKPLLRVGMRNGWNITSAVLNSLVENFREPVIVHTYDLGKAFFLDELTLESVAVEEDILYGYVTMTDSAFEKLSFLEEIYGKRYFTIAVETMTKAPEISDLAYIRHGLLVEDSGAID